MAELVFGAEPEPAAAQPAPAPVEAEQPQQEQLLNLDGTPFTDEEKKQIADFSKQIDIRNTQGVIGYGSGVQKKMADFSESVLQSVRTKDLGEVGGMLSSVMIDLKSFNPDEEEKKGGFLGLFRKQSRKIEELKAGYDRASVNVDKVSNALQQHEVRLLKDVDMLDKMYASNLEYYKQLTMYIAAGKQKINDVKMNDLPAAKAKAEASGLAEDAQAAKDLEDQLTRFEKKVYDLELTRAVALQTAPQIRMIQNNDTMMVEKIQSTIVNTIPLWKNQMVLALGLNDSLVAAHAENEVNDMTNQLLRQNAAKLKQTTIETAKASERGIVDIETLKETNQSLISTLDEVAKIQSEGRQKRAEAEAELQQMENQMKAKLLSMQSGALDKPSYQQ
ncbi:MAG: toxic anion resistance protein [Chordicoccus sp.]